MLYHPTSPALTAARRWRGPRGLAAKVYLVIALVVTGFAGSLLVIVQQNQRSNRELSLASDTLFPAVQLSQAALTEFGDQYGAYEDAVTLGDPDRVDDGDAHAQRAGRHLQELRELTALPEPFSSVTRELQADLARYTENAREKYRALAYGDPSGPDEATALFVAGSALRERLAGLARDLASSMTSRIGAAQVTAHRGVQFSLIALLGVSIVGFVLAGLLARRLIVVPARSLIRQALQIADGDMGVSLDHRADGEFGDLSAALSRMMVTLRGMVDELTRSRDAAQAAGKAKGEFLATMSHELRTPLNGVLGMTELMLRTPLDSVQRRYASTALASGTALLGIINDILDFSKIEAGRVEIEQIPFDLRQLVEEVAASFGVAAHRKGLELITRLPSTMPAHVIGDPLRLRQILTNLIGNAVKFTENGEVLVSVGGVPMEGSGLIVRTTVRDTGIGIDPAHQAHIFNAFTQADGTVTRRFGGTGLGLSICRRLVDLMGGTLGVSSEAGRGSEFWFEVPLRRDTAADTGTATHRQLALVTKRVLVVDDHPTNRELVREQLAHWNIEVETAADGEEALQRLSDSVARGTEFDVVLLDLQMPGMSGLDVAVRIRQREALRSLRLAILSSAGQPVSRATCRELRISHQVTKPVRLSELQQCLAQCASDDTDVCASSDAGDPTLTCLIERPTAPRILLVEDNAVNQAVASAMLEQMGCHVTLAADGLQAISHCEAHEYALILMDCMMPSLDGYEATRRIRSREAACCRSRTPIVALTANASDGDRERCLAAGMDDYLSKPVTLQALTAKVARWLPTPPEPVSAAEAPDDRGAARDESALDTAALASLQRLDPDGSGGLVRRVLTLFLEGAPQQIARLEEAIRDVDPEKLRQVAHAMKSSCANVGALALAQLYRNLELMAREQRMTDAAAALDALRAEQARVLACAHQQREAA
jgi:signal transduction histidine kinase/CheY-like chemotaxis protein/HPt (histidine-containing phosphotransfer) domain-containing protein